MANKKKLENRKDGLSRIITGIRLEELAGRVRSVLNPGESVLMEACIGGVLYTLKVTRDSDQNEGVLKI